MTPRIATAVTADPLPTKQFLRLRFDRFEIDEANARLTDAGKRMQLAPKPFAFLCALARTPLMLVTKNALLESIWGCSALRAGGDNSLSAGLLTNPRQG